MQPLTPVYTADLFPPLHDELIRLLRGLGERDWTRPTIAGAWTVRDVAGHLLDVDLRKLSGGRDEHRIPNAPGPAFDEIVGFINRLNAGGVAYAARLSPRVLVDLLEVAGRWISEFVAALPPVEDADIAVAWAAEDRSPNWMDIGREYTEHWHHQMQIREAVGGVPLLERRWLHPVLDLSVRAFRRAYAPVQAAAGTSVVFEVDAEPDYVWSVVQDPSGWIVMRGRAPQPAASVRAGADTAWKLLYNAVPLDAARDGVAVSGDAALADPMLRARAVMVSGPTSDPRTSS